MAVNYDLLEYRFNLNINVVLNVCYKLRVCWNREGADENIMT
jgi:hypothetical protein